MMQKAWGQNYDVAGHIGFVARKHSVQTWWGSSSLLFGHYWSPAFGTDHIHGESSHLVKPSVKLPHWQTIKCFHGESKSYQVDNQYSQSQPKVFLVLLLWGFHVLAFLDINMGIFNWLTFYCWLIFWCSVATALSGVQTLWTGIFDIHCWAPCFFFPSLSILHVFFHVVIFPVTDIFNLFYFILCLR